MRVKFKTSAYQLIGELADLVEPRPHIAPATWAAKNLVSGDGPWAGELVNLADRTPYLVDIVNAWDENDLQSKIVFQKSKQCGYTDWQVQGLEGDVWQPLQMADRRYDAIVKFDEACSRGPVMRDKKGARHFFRRYRIVDPQGQVHAVSRELRIERRAIASSYVDGGPRNVAGGRSR